VRIAFVEKGLMVAARDQIGIDRSGTAHKWRHGTRKRRNEDGVIDFPAVGSKKQAGYLKRTCGDGSI